MNRPQHPVTTERLCELEKLVVDSNLVPGPLDREDLSLALCCGIA